jgi:hypothetical protein
MDIQDTITIGFAVIGLFAAVAAVTPNKTDDKAAQFLLDLINLLGANVGKAKNDSKN